MTRQQIIDDFHNLYYGPYNAADTANDRNCTFLGRGIHKFPGDLWMYQEIVYKLKPKLIVECGSGVGGSAFYLSTLLDLAKCGKDALVISIDVYPITTRPHRRTHQILSDSVDPVTVEEVKDYSSRAAGHVMVILDSDHSKRHVLNEMNAYHGIVTSGSYLIVEDSNINGHPAAVGDGDGPWEAINEWLPLHPEFEADERCEKFLMTYNPGGYLRKI